MTTTRRNRGVRDDAKAEARGGMTQSRVKAAVRERDGHRCVRCGMTAVEHRERHGRTLEVHRVEPGSLYTLEGCVTLCAGCHGPEPKRQPGAVDLEKTNRPRKAFHAPAELFAALETHILSTRPQPTEADVLRLALEQFLEAAGYWPPKKTS